ncbi:MAG: cache domain-containing protein, partial [Anaerolineales bacterium]
MKLGGLSLRWVIVIPFAMITALSGVAVAGIFWQGKQRDIALVVDELEAMLNQRIQERLSEFLENPNAMNRINAELVRKGILKTQDPNSEIFLRQQLRGVADLSWVYYGAAADGSFVAATRLTEDQTIQTFISDQTTNFIGTYLDENRQIIRQTRPYDARNRPWFQSAIQQQQAVWTDIYASFNTGDLLITAAMPVYDSQQQLLGVVATDYSLEGISQFLQRLKVGRTGIVLIADTAGNLVADSTGTPIFHLDDQTLSRERLVNSRDPLRREVGQLLLKHIAHSGGFNPTLKQRLEIEQTRYFLRMER